MLYAPCMLAARRIGNLGGLVSALLASCTLTPPQSAPLDAELEELTTLLVGDYFSSPDGGAREGRPIYLRIRAVTPPAGRRHALYAEMRHDGPDGEFYRQTIYLFDESPGRSANVATLLGVADRERAARLPADPGGLQRGDVVTTPPLAPGCEMTWKRVPDGFTGRIDPAHCLITGKRGDQRRLESVTNVTTIDVGQLERGFTQGGTLLFGKADGIPYRWPRVRESR